MTAHKIDMIMDFQYGSTGKGLLAGFLAKREEYDTAVCAFGTNAGHTYIDRSRGLNVMTQQLPTAITSPTVKHILLGPGALIHMDTLRKELERYKHLMTGKLLFIHPHACVVEDYHGEAESIGPYSKIGSTTKGVGEAAIERMRRRVDDPNVAVARFKGTDLDRYVTDPVTYMNLLDRAENLLVEGAQGFSLSMYHGQYPYVTSRDVTPWQIAADCGLPMKMAPYIKVIGTVRTYPIRVNNRDGSSGPCYDDQVEISWDSIGVRPELTTVTKLPRRIFTFSQKQLAEALWHCGGYWDTRLFVNFANYMQPDDQQKLFAKIRAGKEFAWNPPTIKWIGYGPDDSDVLVED